MTPEQCSLIETSFAKVVPIADVAATIFYDDLFTRAPRLRSLFKEDLTEQKKNLMAMIGRAVGELRNWNNFSPAVRALGQRHVSYGVKPEDYALVGASLIATLEKGLGADFTPEVRDAWIACYGAISTEMQKAD